MLYASIGIGIQVGIGIGRQLFELFFENSPEKNDKTALQPLVAFSDFRLDCRDGSVPGSGDWDWGLGSNLNSPKDQMANGIPGIESSLLASSWLVIWS